MAPEVIMQEYGPEADLWSVGMLLYQLLTGTFPFWDSVQNISLQQARSHAANSPKGPNAEQTNPGLVLASAR